MTKNFDDFRAQVAGSEVLRQRHKQKMIEVQLLAKNEGVEVVPEDVIAMPSFRMAVYADSNDHVESFEKEGVLIPAIKQARRLKEMREAAPGTPERQALEDLSQAMSPLARMSFARSNGLDKAQAKTQDLSPEKRSELSRQLEMTSDPASRIAIGRKLGLA